MKLKQNEIKYKKVKLLKLLKTKPP